MEHQNEKTPEELGGTGGFRKKDVQSIIYHNNIKKSLSIPEDIQTSENIQYALDCIGPDIPREEWVKVAMALKSELGTDGFSVFDSWSQGGSTYNSKDVRDTWKSINGSGGIGIGTLFHVAKEYGYQPDRHETPEERQQLEQQYETNRLHRKLKQAEEERKKITLQAEAALEAKSRIAQALPADPNHPYLQKKKIEPHSLKQLGDLLFISMFDPSDKIVNIQSITTKGKKIFMKGAMVAGCRFAIGALTGNKFLICEGFATGATLHEATGLPVVLAFTANNLLSVSTLMRSRYSDATIILAADNDHSTLGNPGIKKATEAAKEINGLLAIPDIELLENGTDFNDIAVRHGLYVVRQAVEGCSPVEEEWSEPEILCSTLKPVQSFDFQLLPESVRPWVADIARRMQCPPDFIAVTVIIAMATIIGKKIAIRPKSQDDWIIIVNLWGLLVGRPSVMKTPAMNEGLKPLERLEVEARELFQSLMTEWEVGKEISTIKVEEAKKSARKAFKGGDADKAKNLIADAMNDEEEPTRKRYIVTDATVEKLGELLNQNPNGLLLKRDEIVGFLRNLDREDKAHERGFYLEAFNGDGRYTYDRIGRGTVEVDSVTLSMIGTIQPGRLAAYTHSALAMDSGDDGLIQRFQLAVYPDPVTGWKYQDLFPDTDAKARAWAVFQELDSITPQTNEDNQQFALPFSEDAQEMFISWLTDLEAKIRVEDIHPAIESHLAKYRSLGPSLALIFHLANGYGLTPVRAESAAMAFEWCDYLKSHMERIYGAAVDQAQIAAAALFSKIEQGKIPTRFKLREIRQKGWTGLDTTDALKKAIKVLEDHFYIREKVEPHSVKGGRPSVTYIVNPKVMKVVI